MTAFTAMPPNVYQLDAPPAPETPRLQASRRASLAIVGGGIVGLTAALHLAEAGVDTIVLEAHQPGWGASGNNGGQLSPGLKFDPRTIEETHGPDLGRRMVALAHEGPDRTMALIGRLGIACDAVQKGTLRVARSDAAAKGVREAGAQCLARGMPVEILEEEAAAAATGTDRYRVALLDRRGGNLNPLAYVRGLASAALAAGAAIHGRTPVGRIERTAVGWEISTPTGTVAAEKVLIATNGFTDDLWPQLWRTIVPVFSAIAASEPLPPAARPAVVPSGASVYESGRITVYYRVDAKGRLLVGGRGPMRHISSPEDIAYLTRYAERLWPSIAGLPWSHGWNSRLAMTEDHWPHVREPAAGVLV